MFCEKGTSNSISKLRKFSSCFWRMQDQGGGSVSGRFQPLKAFFLGGGGIFFRVRGGGQGSDSFGSSFEHLAAAFTQPLDFLKTTQTFSWLTVTLVGGSSACDTNAPRKLSAVTGGGATTKCNTRSSCTGKIFLWEGVSPKSPKIVAFILILYTAIRQQQFSRFFPPLNKRKRGFSRSKL